MYPTSLPLPPPSLLSSSSSPLQPHQPHPLPHPQSATATATASVSKKKKDGVDVIVRGPLDIIMGRGCHDNKSGNERLKQLVGMYYEQYNTTRLKNGKSALVANIYQQIQQSGSRFLVKSKDTPGHWIIAAYKKAYNKISHDFRNMRLKVALATTTTTSTMDADVPIKRPAHIMATTDTNIINSTTTTTDIIQSKYKVKAGPKTIGLDDVDVVTATATATTTATTTPTATATTTPTVANKKKRKQNDYDDTTVTATATTTATATATKKKMVLQLKKKRKRDTQPQLRHSHFNNGEFSEKEKKAMEEATAMIPADIKIGFLDKYIILFQSMNKDQLLQYLEDKPMYELPSKVKETHANLPTIDNTSVIHYSSRWLASSLFTTTNRSAASKLFALVIVMVELITNVESIYSLTRPKYGGDKCDSGGALARENATGLQSLAKQFRSPVFSKLFRKFGILLNVKDDTFNSLAQFLPESCRTMAHIYKIALLRLYMEGRISYDDFAKCYYGGLGTKLYKAIIQPFQVTLDQRATFNGETESKQEFIKETCHLRDDEDCKVFGPGVFSASTPFHTEQRQHGAFIVFRIGKYIYKRNIELLDIKGGVQTARIIGSRSDFDLKKKMVEMLQNEPFCYDGNPVHHVTNFLNPIFRVGGKKKLFGRGNGWKWVLDKGEYPNWICIVEGPTNLKYPFPFEYMKKKFKFIAQGQCFRQD